MQNWKEKFDKSKFDSALDRGLCHGVGDQNGQMCIEAAICYAFGLPHGDDPGCVSEAVRSFKITLNDSGWSSPAARASGLRELGIAQLGSKGVVNDVEFARLLAEKTIRVIIPKLFREVFADKPELLACADRCEKDGDYDAARAASAASYAASYAASAASAASYAARDAASYAASAASYAASYAASAARDAASYAASYAAKRGDEYLNAIAKCALDVLKQLKSPGCELL